jgi:ATP-grasp domain, R2K clade family 2
MPMLVLPPRYTPDSIALADAGMRAKWEVQRLHSWRVPDWLKGRKDIVLYGEPLFAAAVAEDLGLALLEPPLRWLAELGEEHRRRKVSFTTLAEARNLGGPTFVKPADDKCFIAKVFGSGQELPGENVLPGATPVLVAEPVTWILEFRCFVLDRKVLTLSPYLRRRELAQTSDGNWPATNVETDEASAFSQNILADSSIRLPPAVALDVGIIENRGWAVVEANAPWGSGIYGCDPNEVLRVVERACIRADKLSSEDREWVIERL